MPCVNGTPCYQAMPMPRRDRPVPIVRRASAPARGCGSCGQPRSAPPPSIGWTVARPAAGPRRGWTVWPSPDAPGRRR